MTRNEAGEFSIFSPAPVSGSSIPHHFQTLHSSEMRGVVRDDWHRMRERELGSGEKNEMNNQQ